VSTLVKDANAIMTRRKKVLLGFTAAAFVLSAYLLWPRPIYDYFAGASGVVVDADGSPVPEVRVTFRSAEIVYEAISPLRSAQTITDARGHFAFSFISCGKPGGRYRLTFEKEGLKTVGVIGRGSGKHRIVMHAAHEQPAA
jgi:hypothetical protein